MGSIVVLNPQHAIVAGYFWFDNGTGDWEKGCQIGRARADLAVHHMAQKEHHHPMFIRSMRDMIQKGRFTGIEAGFFQRLLEIAITGYDTGARK